VRRGLYRHPKALADVEESAVYIGLDSPTAAMRFLNAVDATMRLLVENPEIGPTRTFDRNELVGVRAFPVRGFDKHLIFYRPTDNGIEVLRVLHGARDLGANFGD
jgi:toxin ParE1/3/4